jgi:hypothetical protein
MNRFDLMDMSKVGIQVYWQAHLPMRQVSTAVGVLHQILRSEVEFAFMKGGQIGKLVSW